MTKTENIKCTIRICLEPAAVLLVQDRPRTTATRSADHPCWTGHRETKLCAPHAADEAEVFVRDGMAFYGDVITVRAL